MIVGIDNGLSGGIVWLNDDGSVAHKLVMPVLVIGTHNTYNISQIVAELKFRKPTEAFLEYAQAMPGQGVRSMFMIGYGFGLMEGILSSLEIPYTIVKPKRWQEMFFKDLPKDDTGKLSAIVCQRKWPGVDWRKSERASVPHLGITDAALIAAYGLKQRGDDGK